MPNHRGFTWEWAVVILWHLKSLFKTPVFVFSSVFFATITVCRLLALVLDGKGAQLSCQLL
jgi:hypothetical protein